MPTTLSDLPPEIIHQIASYLPSASSITALDETCRSLHASTADEYGIYRGFALANFPSVTFPALWREATRALTTRSRAWDRKAFVGRVLRPTNPSDGHKRAPSDINVAGPRQKIGYAPALDSYEEWIGNTWADRREVVAWGAGGRIFLRHRERAPPTKDDDKCLGQNTSRAVPVKSQWVSMNGSRGESAHEDILDLRLMQPSQRVGEGEELFIRRANHTITRIHCDLETNKFTEEAFLESDSMPIEAMDLSSNQKPFLVSCHPECLNVYSNTTSQGSLFPISSIQRSSRTEDIARARSLKFLTSDRFAVAEQRLHGGGISPIRVYQIAEDRTAETNMTKLSSNVTLKPGHRMLPIAIAPLQVQTSASADPGHVFLAGWSDGVVRLHDDRSPLAVLEYRDSVDDGVIASVLPVGQESFIAGGHHNACLKLFDLRMSGARPYSYLNASGGTNQEATRDSHSGARCGNSTKSTDMNILLALRMNAQTKRYEPVERTIHNPRFGRRTERYLRYGGSVYSLSTPSSASRTIFAGIENHVVQLDLASTDDILKSRLNNDWDLELEPIDKAGYPLLELAGYNRPPMAAIDLDQYVSMGKVELRRQQPFDKVNGDSIQGAWDPRWQVSEYGRKNDRWNRT